MIENNAERSEKIPHLWCRTEFISYIFSTFSIAIKSIRKHRLLSEKIMTFWCQLRIKCMHSRHDFLIISISSIANFLFFFRKTSSFKWSLYQKMKKFLKSVNNHKNHLNNISITVKLSINWSFSYILSLLLFFTFFKTFKIFVVVVDLSND